MACCCFSNNVRHIVLLLATFSIAVLYANLILFNFTAVLHKDLAPWLRPVEGLDSLHEYSLMHERVKRAYNLTNTADIEEKTHYTEEEGYPLLPSTKPLPTTTTTITTTVRPTKPRLVFFTNSPTSRATQTTRPHTTRVARQTAGTTTGPSTSTERISTIPTTMTSATTTTRTTEEPTTKNVVLEEVRKAIKKYEDKDVDENNNPVDKVEDITTKQIMRDPVSPTKSSEQIKQAELMESVLPRLLIYSAPGIGCLFGTLPSMFLVKGLGVRVALTIALISSAILIFILPFILFNGWIIFTIRLLLGFTFSISFPVAGALTASWGTLTEQLSFLATIFMFFVLAPILSWPITMVLYSNDANLLWIYVVHAIIAFITAISFFIFYRDQPQVHPWVNGIELNRVVAGKVRDLKTNRASTAPCSMLLRSLSAWSIWIAAFGFFSIFAFFSTYLPSFFSCQEVFMVDHLGAYSVLPYFSLPLMFIIGGILNNLSCSSTTLHVRICNSVAFLGGALLLFIIPIVFHADRESPLILPLLLISLAPLGLAVSGFIRSVTLVGRGFAQHIVSCFGLVLGMAYTLIPLMVDTLVNENSLKEWTTNFFICAGILVLTAIIFGVFGRGRSAGWAESTWDPLVRTKMLTTDPIDISADECGLYEMKLIPKPKD